MYVKTLNRYTLNNVYRCSFILLITIIIFFLSPVKSYSQISSTQSEPILTQEEQQWIKEHPTLKVAVGRSWPPLEFVRNGVAYGFSVDYLRLVANKVGIKIDFVTDLAWAEQMALFRDHKIDVASGVSKTLERQQDINYSEPYLVTPFVYFGRKGSKRINTVEDLKGRIFGFTKGVSNIENYKRLFPDIKIIEYNNTEEVISALSAGEIDVVTNVQSVINYHINQNKITNLEIIGNSTFPKSNAFLNYRLSFRNDYPILQTIFEKSMDLITPEEFRQLSNKWINLYNTLLQNDIELTGEEREWLNNNKVIKVSTALSSLPSTAINDSGEIIGISRSYLDIFAQMLNIRFEWAGNENWSDGLNKVKTGEAHMLTAIAETPERSEFLDFTDSYLDISYAIFSRKDGINYRNMDELAGRTIAQIKDGAVNKTLAEQYPAIKVLEVNSAIESLDLLVAGKVDAIINSIPVIARLLAEKGMTQITISGDTPFRFKLTMGVRKDIPIFTNILQKVLHSISLEERAEISRRWMSLEIIETQNNTIIIQIVTIALIVSAIILFWIYSLRREIHRRKIVQEKLIRSKSLAKSANEAKSRFLSNMSHEIRTPLNAIIGFSEIMSSGIYGDIGSAKYNEYLKDIKISGEHLSTVVTDILDLTRIEEGQWSLHESDFSAREIIESSLIMLQGMAEEKSINISYFNEINSDDISIYGDQNAFNRILINLLSNAIKFTNEGGEVTIKLKQINDGGLSIEVNDNGIGIAADKLRQVVKPFVQLDEDESSRETGTGLGLSIVRQLTQLHGGEFILQSEINKGTNATITIPSERIQITAHMTG